MTTRLLWVKARAASKSSWCTRKCKRSLERIGKGKRFPSLIFSLPTGKARLRFDVTDEVKNLKSERARERAILGVSVMMFEVPPKQEGVVYQMAQEYGAQQGAKSAPRSSGAREAATASATSGMFCDEMIGAPVRATWVLTSVGLTSSTSSTRDLSLEKASENSQKGIAQ